MWKVFSVVQYLSPSYWKVPARVTQQTLQAPEPEPIDFIKYPLLKQLEEIGATKEQLRKCQEGFKSLVDLEKSIETGVDRKSFDKLANDFLTAYRLLLKTEGITLEHIIMFNYIISLSINKIKAGKYTELNIPNEAYEYSAYISKDLSAQDIYMKLLQQSGQVKVVSNIISV